MDKVSVTLVIVEDTSAVGASLYGARYVDRCIFLHISSFPPSGKKGFGDGEGKGKLTDTDQRTQLVIEVRWRT